MVLEHVSGGELFDYLVSKGRLSEREVCTHECMLSVYLLKLPNLPSSRLEDSSNKLFQL